MNRVPEVRHILIGSLLAGAIQLATAAFQLSERGLLIKSLPVAPSGVAPLAGSEKASTYILPRRPKKCKAADGRAAK
ncbi:MAG: hypothetical protein WC421_02875 [Elusimicrobiales bacterium]